MENLLHTSKWWKIFLSDFISDQNPEHLGHLLDIAKNYVVFGVHNILHTPRILALAFSCLYEPRELIEVGFPLRCQPSEHTLKHGKDRCCQAHNHQQPWLESRT